MGQTNIQMRGKNENKTRTDANEATQGKGNERKKLSTLTIYVNHNLVVKVFIFASKKREKCV